MSAETIKKILEPLVSQGVLSHMADAEEYSVYWDKSADEPILVPVNYSENEIKEYIPAIRQMFERLNQKSLDSPEVSFKKDIFIEEFNSRWEQNVKEIRLDVETRNFKFQSNFSAIALAILGVMLGAITAFAIWGIDKAVDASKKDIELQMLQRFYKYETRLHTLELKVAEQEKRSTTHSSK
jgi:hypothetical protein